MSLRNSDTFFIHFNKQHTEGDSIEPISSVTLTYPRKKTQINCNKLPNIKATLLPTCILWTDRQDSKLQA